jgi:hypothetical protein
VVREVIKLLQGHLVAVTEVEIDVGWFCYRRHMFCRDSLLTIYADTRFNSKWGFDLQDPSRM